MYPSSVTDAEWTTLEPLLPAPGSTAGRGGRPEKHCRLLIVDAILYIVRSGIAWRQLPMEFPPAGTVYAVFARWSHSGAWQRIVDALRDRLRVRDGRDRCPTAAIIYSQTVPAADTVPRSSRDWDGGKRTNGVKRHVAMDVNGLLLAVVVTAASIQDRRRAPTPDRTARQVLHHPAGLGRRRLSRTAARLGERRSRPAYTDHQTHPRRPRLPRPTPRVGGREKFRVDQQAPPLRARLRNQTRPPRGHGSHRDDRDHDEAARPNLTVFKRTLTILTPVLARSQAVAAPPDGTPPIRPVDR
nr:IS5 family transposase [Rhodococcus koreensis]